MAKQPRSTKRSHRPSPLCRPVDRTSALPSDRVRLEKPERPRYLDIRKDDAAQAQHFNLGQQLASLRESFSTKQRIAVISGAGISVNASIPDFRSLSGPNKSSRDLFDISVYNSDESTRRFHEMISDIFVRTSGAQPTRFHRFLGSLAQSGRLVRHYTQNIDCIESQLPSLSPGDDPLRTKGPWPPTIQLHGRLDKTICQKCRHCDQFVPGMFRGSELPLCTECERSDIERAMLGKRSRGVGVLRPKITLHGEDSPDESAITAVIENDMLQSPAPDCVVIAGTRLKVPGARRLARDLCRAAKESGAESLAVWINMEPPSLDSSFDSLIDCVVVGDCDGAASFLSAQR